jgi:hypothetical protein
MYCSSCGSAIPQNLSYCSRCGAKVGGANVEGGNRPAELSPNLIVCAIAVVFFAGMTATFALLALMKEGGGVDPIVLAAAILSFVMMFLIEAVLMWMLVRSRKGGRAAAAAAERLSEHTTKEPGEAQARVLPEPASSVTEQTTRTFDPAYSERKAK